MSTSVIFDGFELPFQMHGRPRRRRGNGDRRDGGAERDRPPTGDADGHSRHDDLRPRKRGKHGCDRVRGQGTRRRID